jgi:tmRNA-binding protein
MNFIMFLVGLCRGNMVHDTRARERAREHQRDIERALGERR